MDKEVVTDITPDHLPVSLLRSMEATAMDSVAGFVILLGKDDELHYEGCGVTKKDLLWALRKMEKQVLEDDVVYT